MQGFVDGLHGSVGSSIVHADNVAVSYIPPQGQVGLEVRLFVAHDKEEAHAQLLVAAVIVVVLVVLRTNAALQRHGPIIATGRIDGGHISTPPS